MFQTTAPAVADRLAQNLWVDTTGGANTPKRWSGSAWVAVTDKVATDAASAVATTAAALTVEQTARANADSALSTQLTTLSSNTGNSFATVQQQFTAQSSYTDGAVARALTTVTVNGKKAVFGISSDGVVAEIGAVADRFYVYNPLGGTYTLAFAVVNGQTVIQDAMIREASITTAKIANAAITGAKIANATIGSAQIADASITSAKISQLSADKITSGYLSADRINAGTISASMILSNSATSFERATIWNGNGGEVTVPFYMDHDGKVAVVCTALWTQSGNSGSWSIRSGVNSLGNSASGSWYSSAAPNPPVQMTGVNLKAGWHTVNLSATISTATGSHLWYVLILRSYR